MPEINHLLSVHGIAEPETPDASLGYNKKELSLRLILKQTKGRSSYIQMAGENEEDGADASQMIDGDSKQQQSESDNETILSSRTRRNQKSPKVPARKASAKRGAGSRDVDPSALTVDLSSEFGQEPVRNAARKAARTEAEKELTLQDDADDGHGGDAHEPSADTQQVGIGPSTRASKPSRAAVPDDAVETSGERETRVRKEHAADAVAEERKKQAAAERAAAAMMSTADASGKAMVNHARAEALPPEEQAVVAEKKEEKLKRKQMKKKPKKSRSNSDCSNSSDTGFDS
eukprot:4053874-Pleurochrysis_carterae.AAC.2